MGSRWKSIRFHPDIWFENTKNLGREERSILLDIAVYNWEKRKPMDGDALYLMLSGGDDAIDMIYRLEEGGYIVDVDDGTIGVPDEAIGAYVATIVTEMAKRQGNHGRPEKSLWRAIRERIFKRDDYTCRYCGQRGGKLECDHVLALSRGGSNTDDNLTTSCVTCNRVKWAKTLEELGWNDE